MSTIDSEIKDFTSYPHFDPAIFAEKIKDPKLQQEFRDRLAQILRMGRFYNWETQLLDFKIAVSEFKYWIKTAFKWKKGYALPDEIRTEIELRWHPGENRKRIDDLLEYAKEQLEKRELEHLRRWLKSEILKQKPTPESWVKMKTAESRTFRVLDLSLLQIAKKFGLQVHAILTRADYLALGRKIYGEDHFILHPEPKEDLSLDNVRQIILSQYPTPESWLYMGDDQKQTLKIYDMGLNKIANKIGIHGKPISDYFAFLEFGRLIYGQHQECLRPLTCDEIRLEVKRRIPDIQTWNKMTIREREKLSVRGMRLRDLSQLFEIEGGPFNNEVYILLGRRIYNAA